MRPDRSNRQGPGPEPVARPAPWHGPCFTSGREAAVSMEASDGKRVPRAGPPGAVRAGAGGRAGVGPFGGHPPSRNPGPSHQQPPRGPRRSGRRGPLIPPAGTGPAGGVAEVEMAAAGGPGVEDADLRSFRRARRRAPQGPPGMRRLHGVLPGGDAPESRRRPGTSASTPRWPGRPTRNPSTIPAPRKW